MNQLEKTQDKLAGVESSGKVLIHIAELCAMILDRMDQGFNVRRGGPVKKRTGTQPHSIKTFLAECHEAQEQPIAGDDPVFKYAVEKGIPREFVALCWKEFVERSLENSKRQKNWRQTFRNCVRQNWYKLWYCKPDGSYELTSGGHQASQKHGALNG